MTSGTEDRLTDMKLLGDGGDISVTETITETEIIDRALTKTETETMLIYETEII